jgi:hypothetical protein
MHEKLIVQSSPVFKALNSVGHTRYANIEQQLLFLIRNYCIQERPCFNIWVAISLQRG